MNWTLDRFGESRIINPQQIRMDFVGFACATQRRKKGKTFTSKAPLFTVAKKGEKGGNTHFPIEQGNRSDGERNSKM